MRRFWMNAIWAVMLLSLSGCGNFFVYPGSTTTTATSTGDYVYAVNSASNALTGYVIGSGTLTLISGLPVSLETGLAARSIAVSRSNGFVYVGGSGATDCFAIGSAGILTAVSAARVTATVNFVSLETSYDGKWLFGLDTLSNLVYVYSLNTTTGVPTLVAGNTIAAPNTGTLVVPTQVRIAPSNNVVAVALGTAGTVFFAFNDSTGALTQATTGAFAANYSDNAVAFDLTSGYAYIGRTVLTAGSSGVASYSVTTAGIPASLNGLVASGAAPNSLTTDLTGAYLYSGNRTDSSVTGYTVSNGTLTVLPSGPYASSPTTTGLVRDNSGKYLLSIGATGTNDVALLALDALTAGKLDAVVTASTGTAGLIAVAATHTTAGL